VVSFTFIKIGSMNLITIVSFGVGNLFDVNVWTELQKVITY